jgi:ABC-2 type transport system permease protein
MLVKQIYILSKFRWAAVKNASRGAKKRWGGIIFLATLFVLADYWFFFRIIRYLDGLPFKVGEELIVQLVNLVFITLFFMVMFSSLIVSLSVYYLSKDLELLHSMPVSIKPLIAVRFGQCMVHSSWVVLLFSVPMFAAYGNFFQVPLEFYAWFILNMLPFIAIPCLLAVMGIMCLMKYFPTHKIHQVLSLLGLFFLVGTVLYLRFLSQDKFFGQDVSDEMIVAFVETLKAPDYAFLPSSWITQSITGWVAGHREGLLLIWSTALILFFLLMKLGSRIYFSSWCAVQEVRSAPLGVAAKEAKRQPLFSWLPFPQQWKTLLTKDFKVFIRDPEQWSQLFILCALVCVYIFNIMHLPLENRVLRDVVSVLNVGLVGFVMAALISRFVFSSLSIEGKSFWSIYTKPVTMRGFIACKFWMFFPALLVIAELLVVASNHLLEVDDYVMTVSVIGVFLLTLGLTGLGLGLGTLYPQFDYENISEISSSTGGIIYMTLALSLIGLILVLGARPVYVHFNERFLFKSIGGMDVPICYTLIVVLTAAATFIPLRSGIHSLNQRDV